jgi:predicted Zn-dependent protease
MIDDFSMPRPDSLYYQAASGWLDLGKWDEANAELDRITPQLGSHPAVLYMRCLVYTRARKWELAFEVARHLVRVWPEESACWTLQARALRHMKGGGPGAAWQSLLPVADKFSDMIDIPYGLACYAAQTGRIAEAKQWLERAFALGDAKELKLRALDEPDLEPLWDKIGSL